MATFQDARDGLDALLQDKGKRLEITAKDKHIVEAGRYFSRRRGRVITKEIQGDGGFTYVLPTEFIDGFSTIEKIITPYDVTFQDPEPLEPKDFRLQRSESLGLRLHFINTSPSQNDKFLIKFSAPHTVDPEGGGRVIGSLTPVGTPISAAQNSSEIDVEKANGARIFLRVASVTGGQLDVFVQASTDQIDWTDIGSFNPISAPGDAVLALEKSKVSKFVRLRYALPVAGTFTLSAVVETRGNGTLTIPDHQLDVFNYLSASIAARALAGFYASMVDSTLQGDTSDFEGKSTFWSQLAKDWKAEFELGMDTVKTPDQSATPWAQGEWDIKGTTGFRYLTHPRRFR